MAWRCLGTDQAVTPLRPLCSFIIAAARRKYCPGTFSIPHVQSLKMACGNVSSPQETPLQLPGLNLPINWKPQCSRTHDRKLLPNALDPEDIEGGWLSNYVFTTRELLMMRIMDAITDKPDWDKKVWDDAITAKWREEIAHSGEDVSPPMMDWIIKEVQWRAEKQYRDLGFVESYSPGVVKSDSAISEDLRQALRDAVKPLEEVPANQKDYHPGSDDKVVDLVHPSLFPLIYGRTWVLHDKTTGLDDYANRIGEGKLTQVPAAPEPPEMPAWRRHVMIDLSRAYSCKFQWLPCDVRLDTDGGCHIESYINNLHPVQHRSLYPILEEILGKTIPLWGLTLGKKRELRIQYTRVEYVPRDTPEPEYPEGDDPDYDAYDDLREQWQSGQTVVQPEPGEFKPPAHHFDDPGAEFRAKYGEKGLQVIVKLANIELTPEKPEYDGGSWHVEGQLNERICATALYYYDSKNITESRLSFRHRPATGSVQHVPYPQDEHEFLQQVFGFDPDLSRDDTGDMTQNLGSVCCRQGRLLTFPNTLQHRVSPFSLADRSKPGHRKMLAFFLIDPSRRIISTANVPPQREDWCKEKEDLVHKVLGDRLPAELQAIVRRNLKFRPITMKEAKEYRLELMEERSIQTKELSARFETGSFSLCEH